MLRLQGLLLPLVYAPRRGEVHCRLVEVMWCTVARWHISIHGPLRWPQPRTPVSGTTSDARIMTRLECRYGDMTQSRLTCPVIRSGDGRRAGTARLGREPTTYRLICVHDSVAAYSHLTRRTTDLARGDMRGGDSGVGDAGAGFRAGRLVNSCVVQDVWRSTVDVGNRRPTCVLPTRR